MAHYYFDLHEDGTVSADPEGRDFPSLEVARKSAVRDARSLLCDGVHHGCICMYCFIEVMDADREFIARVLFTDAVAIED